MLTILLQSAPEGVLTSSTLKKLFEPLNIGFEAIRPLRNAHMDYTGGENSAKMPQYRSHHDNKLWSEIIALVLSWVEYTATTQRSMPAQQHRKKLLESGAKYADIMELCMMLNEASRLLSYDALGMFKFLEEGGDAAYLSYPGTVGAVLTLAYMDCPNLMEKVSNLFVLESCHIYCLVGAMERVAAADLSVFNYKTFTPGHLSNALTKMARCSSPDELKTPEAKHAVKEATSPAIYDRVLKACSTLYSRSFEQGMDQQQREHLRSCAVNGSAMWAVYFIFQGGPTSYLKPQVLRCAILACDAWVAILQDLRPGFSPSLAWTSRWLGAYVDAVHNASDKVAGSIDSMVASVVQEMTQRNGPKPDIPLTIEAMGRFCYAAQFVPLFLERTAALGIGRLAAFMHHLIEVYQVKLMDPTLLTPQSRSVQRKLLPVVLNNIAMMMKAVRELSAMPVQRLMKLNHPNYSTLESMTGLHAEILSGCFMAAGAVEVCEDEIVRAEKEKELAAASLDVLHTLAAIPPQMRRHHRFLNQAGRLLDSVVPNNTLAEVLDTEIVGLDQVIELGGTYLQGQLMNMQWASQRNSAAWGAMEYYANDMKQAIEKLTDLKAKAKKATSNPEVERERAVKRAQVLAMLPCSRLGCLTLPKVGKDKIVAKRCSGCVTARYCSAECQKKDWPVHKVACKALTAAKGKK